MSLSRKTYRIRRRGTGREPTANCFASTAKGAYGRQRGCVPVKKERQ